MFSTIRFGTYARSRKRPTATRRDGTTRPASSAALRRSWNPSSATATARGVIGVSDSRRITRCFVARGRGGGIRSATRGSGRSLAITVPSCAIAILSRRSVVAAITCI
ncbi:gp4 [Caviid betaherpesvirus 2]|uniref:Gp4 n=1 Tax=Guinea pig cytomegalovirus (strain 22122) TaxID=103920 RepID=B7TPT5_GPCMV|nr:gp4 [Caviid betaherpesvirus 2]AGE11497.1 gp4 [Caviid betaherpesvirus 2]AIL83885.1 gp4 [BAC cloning vector GPN13BACdenovo_preserved(MM)]BAJ78487.1 gp4 [Caviid betaherpesvirus 2]